MTGTAREHEPEINRRPTINRGHIKKRNYRQPLLEKQTHDLNKMMEYVSDCARYSRKSFAVHQKRLAVDEKRFQLEEEKFRFERQMRLEEQELRCKQLQLKLQMLDYKKQKLDFKMGRATTEQTEKRYDTCCSNEEI